jgi:NAD(P)H-nitrite reductase large subunit
VAQGKDFSTGGFNVQAIQPTAVEHGRIAARNMVQGHDHVHRGSVNMNVLDTLGLISSSFAMWMGVDGGDNAEVCDPNRFRYVNLQFKDDILVGASTLGLTEHVGVVRGLIESKVKLDGWKDKLKQDPTRLMEAYIASTQALGHNAYVI